MNQEALMRYCPETGLPEPYPSHAAQWRKYHGPTAWLYNPWSGSIRDVRDISTDVFGYLIVPAGEKQEPMVLTTNDPLVYCAANRDGECSHPQCPQHRDGEPATSDRSCPLPDREES